MEKENMKKDEALKALQNQVSEETIKASMLILSKILFLLKKNFLSGDIPVAFSVFFIDYLHKNQSRGKDFHLNP